MRQAPRNLSAEIRECRQFPRLPIPAGGGLADGISAPGWRILNRVVATARAWIGTPYVHQASLRGAGCDCLGLIRGVWRDLGRREPTDLPPYTRDWSEAGGSETLLAAARRFLVERPTSPTPLPGQVLLFRMRETGVAKHLGIVSCDGAEPRFIHAYSGRAVCETTLSRPWLRRVVATFDYPEEMT